MIAITKPPFSLPWDHGGQGLIYGQCSEHDHEAPFVADVIEERERAAFGLLTDREREHAEFICRAANSHAGLIEALQAALLALNIAPRFRVRETDSYAIASLVHDALAKAGAP
mgnify:CR=1 FL=1